MSMSTISEKQHLPNYYVHSGTSGGERKMMPAIEEDFGRRYLIFRLLMPIMNQFVPDLDKGKGMYLMFTRNESKTPGGIKTSAALTRFYKSSHFLNRSYNPFTSPNETVLCLDSYQSMYSQLLCGLCQNNEVLRVGAVFATSLIHAVRFLEKNWSLLCDDIRTGTINPLITDISVREAVMKILKSDKNLVDFIQSECSKGSWQGIITRLWPNTKYVDVTVTGSMSQYIPTLDYYCNGLPLVSNIYAASEGFFGVNLNPLCKPCHVSYTLIPTMCYYEFLPVNRSNDPVNEKEQQELVDLVDVKLDQEYELVVTTYCNNGGQTQKVVLTD
ncbi:hypothetical protein KIW84_023004 [Lathyrus oleraceus]|uniref:GH3 middle domain-containing protein n=1 Tax=Pisum sativum TaxID=3888 RepID=A0A9D5BBC8_PEA|nr:hypothetical protein KIW84_023004 [Pisum sativum]